MAVHIVMCPVQCVPQCANDILVMHFMARHIRCEINEVTYTASAQKFDAKTRYLEADVELRKKSYVIGVVTGQANKALVWTDATFVALEALGERIPGYTHSIELQHLQRDTATYLSLGVVRDELQKKLRQHRRNGL